MKHSSPTAILLFSRSAAEEAAVKTFDRHSGRNANRAIAQRLIRKATATAHKSGLPVFTCFSTQVPMASGTGNLFGERLANAIEAVYARGFSKVIAIGNDCPELSPELLRHASARLEQENLVMGPAADGGVYLLGLDRAAYSRERFLDLPWQTPQLQQGFSTYAQQDQESICWLENHHDIDHAADFHRFLASKPADRALVRDLKSIIATGLRPRLAPVAKHTSRDTVSFPSLRAPPH